MARWILAAVARTDLLIAAAGRACAVLMPLVAGVALPAWATRGWPRRGGRARRTG